MTTVNLELRFPDLDGKDIPKSPDKPMTFRDAMKVVCTAELATDTQGGAQEVLTNKMNNFEIYLKVREALDIVEFTPEEVVHLKKRAPFILNTLVLGPVIKVLDGKDPYARELKTGV